MLLGLIITGGPFDSSRWLTGYRIASAALKSKHEVFIYLYLDGTNIPVSTQSIHGHEEMLPHRFYKELCDLGAEIIACRVCSDARGHVHGNDYFKHENLKVTSLLDFAVKVCECDRIISL